jgi:uncharacterized beta-barrel protein YwiB (DUF1934 family)
METVKIAFSMSVDGKPEAGFRTDGRRDEGALAFPDGDGGNYFVEYDESVLRIRRTGKTEMDFVFQAGTRTEGILVTAGTTFRLQATTRKLRVRRDRIELAYDLETDGRLVSRHRMLIEWK